MKRLIALFTVLMIASTTARGEPLVALTSTNALVEFTSENPGGASTTAITGLTAGDRLVGIDVRPFNNVLYGVAVDSGVGGANSGVGRIYTINVDTGLATLAATLAADPTDATAPFPFSSVTGEFFGVDFNPTVDRLRVVSDSGQNLRINVTNGLTQLDLPLAYAAADANTGSPPQVVGSAYTNSVSGAGTTSLFALDAALSTLDTQNPANNGTLNTVVITSSSVFADTGFDISGQTGIAYAVLDGLTLTSINLTTGAVTELGAINTIGSISGLAVLVVPEPASVMLLACIALAPLCRRRPGPPLGYVM